MKKVATNTNSKEIFDFYDHRDSLSVAKRFFGGGKELEWKEARRTGEVLDKLLNEFFLRWTEKME